MPLSVELFSKLKSDILHQKYKQGYKLTEQDICSVYNVSRTPVREAFRRLEAEGLIEISPNRGAYVLGFSAQDISDICELRKSCEIQAVKWAIERITEEEFDALEETFEFMEFYTQKNDVDKMMKINANFHQHIYVAAHNRMLRNILSSYRQYMEHMKKNTTQGENHLSLLLQEHRAIYDAFRDKNVALGAEAMEKHMDNSLERWYII